jgi:plasmid stability protein
MGQILVRQLKDETIAAIKARARANNRSAEAEVRAILDEVAGGGAAPAPKPRRSLLELAGSIPTGRTTEEIVAEIRALRDEWDR